MLGALNSVRLGIENNEYIGVIIALWPYLNGCFKLVNAEVKLYLDIFKDVQFA